MNKKTYSYIDSVYAQEVYYNEADADRKLKWLRVLMAAHGEALNEAIEYQKRGADYKIKAVEAECEAWLASTHAPAYFRADSLERARQSLGEDTLKYYKELASALRISFGNNKSLDLAKDIEVTSDGSWCVKQSFIDAQLEAGRVTLNNQESADYEKFLTLRREFIKFGSLGYGDLCQALPLMLDEDVAKDYPLQSFVEAYDIRKDKRKMK